MENILLPSEQLTKKELSIRKELENKEETETGGALNFIVRNFNTKKLIPKILEVSQLEKTAKREFTNFKIVNKEWKINSKNFSGFKILHLTDLHADIEENFATELAEKLKNIKENANICVITGDFQNNLNDEPTATVKAVKEIIKNIQSRMPIYAVPGNHDSIKTLDAVANLGIEFLCNKEKNIECNGEYLSLIGIEDNHFFKLDNIEKATSKAKRNGTRILLAHSPEIYKKAEREKIALCLSGHTHAGQIRLPYVGAIFKQANVPNKMIWGEWKYKNLQGYTSAGTGACGVPYRLNCPPEVIIHTIIN